MALSRLELLGKLESLDFFPKPRRQCPHFGCTASLVRVLWTWLLVLPRKHVLLTQITNNHYRGSFFMRILDRVRILQPVRGHDAVQGFAGHPSKPLYPPVLYGPSSHGTRLLSHHLVLRTQMKRGLAEVPTSVSCTRARSAWKCSPRI